MVAAAIVLGILGTACVVLRSPNQSGRGSRRLPAGFGWIGLALIVLSFWLALETMRPLAAIFAIATLLMLTFTILPAILPLWQARKRTQQGNRHHG